jgi:hypothetical protein
MRMVRSLAAGIMLVALLGVAAQSADLVRLDWGDFTLESDSQNKPKSYDAKAGPGGMTVSMTFDTLTAKADGKVNDASASMSGHFTVHQPRSASMPDLRIELRGRIVKTKGSTARIDVTIGNEQRSIEWSESEEVADAFVRTFNASIEGGQLPNPFTISATASAKKTTDHGAAVITLESLSVEAGSSKVAIQAQQALEAMPIRREVSLPPDP